MSIEDVMKAVGKKFPTCTVIDSTQEDEGFISEKCKAPERLIEVGKKGEKHEVTVCTGSFNVYILSFKEKDAE